MTLEPGDSNGEELATPPARTAKLQWNLRTLFLLTAAVAVWAGFFCHEEPIAQLKREVLEMQCMTTELVVVNPRQIAFARQPQLWRDRYRCDVYLPDNGCVVKLATREVNREGLAPVVGEAKIPKGQHRIDLFQIDRGEQRETCVLVDGQTAFKASDNVTWHGGFHRETGSSSLSPDPWRGTSWPDTPLILLCYRFHPRQENGAVSFVSGPTNGLLLWIERIAPNDSP